MAIKATFVKNVTLGRSDGVVKLYKLSEPVEGTEYVVVSAIPFNYDTGNPETCIFPSDSDGIATWRKMKGSFQGAMDHDRALRGAGWEPEV